MAKKARRSAAPVTQAEAAARDPQPVTVGTTFTVDGKHYTVAAACENKTNGQWFCVEHTAGAFRNQFEKDGHVTAIRYERGPVCRLAWICYQHGPEAP